MSDGTSTQTPAEVTPTPAGATGRQRRLNESLEVLDRACQQIALRPHDEAARLLLAMAVMSAELAPSIEDSALVRALTEEARAHSEDLAFRLERPGYDSIFIGAAAAKLRQTLAVLKEQVRI
jgi:hypothetical protein